MAQKNTIQKIYSLLFLTLTLFSLLGNSANMLLQKEIIKKKDVTANTEKSTDQPTSEETQLIETPFQAVVNAGLHWDFQKHFYILSPIIIDFFNPEKVKVQTPRFKEPLRYFIILFRTSICVHAP